MVDQGNSWLVAAFEPVCLFSLRMTNTTSKGGKTLVVPTPYAVKMALIDACFRAEGRSVAHATARKVFDVVKPRRIRFQPPPHCVVQNTFVKVLDAERDGNLPFKQTIVYREFASFSGGPLEIAMDSSHLMTEELKLIEELFWHINSIGKRGSFWQCVGVHTLKNVLPSTFTAALQGGELSHPEGFGLLQVLDDFGDALCQAQDGFDRISTYGNGTITLGKHRVLTRTALPYQMRSASKRFTWYERILPSSDPRQ